ncbi:winged helix family transcriptional regulator [Photobacterium sanctipauli]|uniref:Winged helix family transcriptional regulator n=1 Tax=Photobacterium sanctipauli TaxID=1342794 RepID=A0A2T3NIA9_9GAMM|nr:winged helix-turn-helix domain-containing protein [Photobacterium sanctipauli]PSW14749.1 winged helix family transcriptional regulator [Photobacterium sanctipauli]
MTTKTLTRCYRFDTVDFEPDLHLLVWKDGTETPLTVHESRLLEAMCFCAGEVISAEPLYDKTFSQIDPYEDNNNHYDLNTLLKSLTQKLERNGQAAIPIEAVVHYGFRVPLPEKTCRLVHQTKTVQPVKPSPPEEDEFVESPTEHIVKHSLLHKISVFLLAAAGLAIVLVSNY